MVAPGERRRASLARCRALRSATWVTEQVLMTNASAPLSGRPTTRTPPAIRLRATASASAWLSLQPRVRMETVGCSGIWGHDSPPPAARPTDGRAGLKPCSYASACGRPGLSLAFVRGVQAWVLAAAGEAADG